MDFIKGMCSLSLVLYSVTCKKHRFGNIVGGRRGAQMRRMQFFVICLMVLACGDTRTTRRIRTKSYKESLATLKDLFLEFSNLSFCAFFCVYVGARKLHSEDLMWLFTLADVIWHRFFPPRSALIFNWWGFKARPRVGVFFLSSVRWRSWIYVLGRFCNVTNCPDYILLVYYRLWCLL